jgi:hypothetical protein
MQVAYMQIPRCDKRLNTQADCVEKQPIFQCVCEKISFPIKVLE